MADIRERLLLPLAGKHPEQMMQKPCRLGMDHRAKLRRALLIVFKRTGIVIAALLISLACGNAVHKHLNHILHRHLHTDDPLLGIYTVVKPVFIMMPVPSLVMQPRRRISLPLALRVIRTSGSLIIPASNQELRRHIFGQVMAKPLPIQTHPKTALPHQPPMMIDRFEMLPRLHIFCISLSLGVL